MLQRVAARLLTGPIAFFLAGVIDIGEFAVRSLWARARRRWRGR